MDEEKVMTEEQEQEASDKLRDKLTEGMEKLRTQSMLLGGKAMATVIYNMIQKFHSMPGKRTLNDHRRLIKEIEKFCKTSVDHEVEIPKFDEEETNE